MTVNAWFRYGKDNIAVEMLVVSECGFVAVWVVVFRFNVKAKDDSLASDAIRNSDTKWKFVKFDNKGIRSKAKGEIEKRKYEEHFDKANVVLP